MQQVEVGIPVKLRVHGICIYGRVSHVRGGIIHMMTPGGSTFYAGLVHYRSLDEEGLKTLAHWEEVGTVSEYEALPRLSAHSSFLVLQAE